MTSAYAPTRESDGPAYLGPWTLVRENAPLAPLTKRAVEVYQPGMLVSREVSRSTAAGLIRAVRAKGRDCVVRTLDAHGQRHFLLREAFAVRSCRLEIARLVIRTRMACPHVAGRSS